MVTFSRMPSELPSRMAGAITLHHLDSQVTVGAVAALLAASIAIRLARVRDLIRTRIRSYDEHTTVSTEARVLIQHR